MTDLDQASQVATPLSTAPAAEPRRGPYKVQVLDRAVAILELLSASSSGEMSLAELTAAIGLHKSTVHRLLQVLEAHQLVSKAPQHGHYRLGTKLFELAHLAAVHSN